jgi:hypothetical protein
MTDVDDALAKIERLREQGWEIIREEGPLTTEVVRDYEHNTHRVISEQSVRFRLVRIEEREGLTGDMVEP